MISLWGALERLGYDFEDANRDQTGSNCLTVRHQNDFQRQVSSQPKPWIYLDNAFLHHMTAVVSLKEVQDPLGADFEDANRVQEGSKCLTVRHQDDFELQVSSQQKPWIHLDNAFLHHMTALVSLKEVQDPLGGDLEYTLLVWTCPAK
jgi:beta-xylosidase